MRYLSICSGIEAASVAWHGLGWTPVAFSEIEPFPSAVLAHHYPHVPNVGDMTKFKEWNLEPIDLLVGGTPCQSFSVAGLRKGLHDPRGGLMLTFLEIAQRYRPRWVVWENVPGVLSSDGGRDFGAFLGALGELGYGWAYRVLDARWFGVAQRRRRVFVVACLGDQASAAAVLFESESVQRNPASSREKGQGAARGVGGGPDGGSISGAVTRKWAKGSGGPAGDECYKTVAQPVAGSHWDHPSNPHPTLNQSAKGSGGIAASDQELFSQRGSGLVPQPVAQPVAFSRNDDGRDATLDLAPTMRVAGRAGGMLGVAQPVAFKVRGGVEVDSAGKAAGKGYLGSEETAFTLAATQDQWIGQPVATFAKTHKPMSATDAEGWSPVDAAPTVTHWPRDRSDAGTDVAVVYERHDQDARVKEVSVAPTLHSKSDNTCDLPMVMQPTMQVRRLTPTECERLQGFPDGYTNIPWRGKPESPDGPRYKALGNSMAVPCMKWIGERIQAATARQEVKP